MFQGRQYGVGCSLTQAAKRVALDVFRKFFKLFQIGHSCFTVGDFGQDFKHTFRADTAGGTFTAGFVADEFHVEFRNVNHTVVFVHDDCTARTHHRAFRNKVVKVNRYVQILFRQATARRTARLDCLELLTVGDTAADVVNQFAQGRTHGDFYQANIVDFTAECKYLRTLRTFRTVLCKRVLAFTQDEGDARERFYVVYDGRLFPQTLYSREGGTGAGHTALTFNRVQECRFFTAYECACAKTKVHAEGEVRTQNVIAEQAEFFRLLDCHVQSIYRDRVFRTNVEITVLRADCITCNHHTFDYGKGITFQDGTVHERTGVAFVAVTYNVLFAFGLRVSELPLSTRRETAAAAAAKTRTEHFFNNVRSVHLQSSRKTLERARTKTFFDIFGVDAAATVQGNTHLLFVEVDVFLFGDFFRRSRVNVKQSVDNFAAD